MLNRTLWFGSGPEVHLLAGFLQCQLVQPETWHHTLVAFIACVFVCGQGKVENKNVIFASFALFGVDPLLKGVLGIAGEPDFSGFLLSF